MNPGPCLGGIGAFLRCVPAPGSGASGLTIACVDPTPTDDLSTPYWLYLLECEGGVYYAGITLDVERRFLQHACGEGARFTRARPPLRVIAAREYPDKRHALRAERQLKALPRARKLAFFDGAQGG
jgi:putative endonuclease